MSAGPRILLLTLSERTSGKGNRYMSGWLGKASVVAFRGEDDRHGNPTWDLFVSEPQPRAERRPEAEQEREVRPRPEPSSRSAGTAAPNTAAKSSASPVARGGGWRGPSRYVRGNSAQRAPAVGREPFYEDSLEDVGR
jgi:hypothetical protein